MYEKNVVNKKNKQIRNSLFNITKGGLLFVKQKFLAKMFNICLLLKYKNN